MERLRFKVQLLSAVFFNIGLFQLHSVCFPVLNCHSCPVSVFSCPLGIIGQFAGVGIIPLSVVGSVALAGVLAGRFLCGWACPFGFLQELLYKVPYVKFSIPSWTRFIKYGLFIGLVVAVPIIFSTSSPIYFCRLCPVGTLESAIPWAIINGTTDIVFLSLRIFILLAVIVLVMGHRRFFCKVICPLGACLSVFNRVAAVFPERKTECMDCGACSRTCMMETSSGESRFGVYDGHPEECISCLECRNKCPSRAISIWGG